MSPKDPILSICEIYGSLLKEYESVIVSSFDVDDFRKCSEILFSAHSCGIEGNSFTVDETGELKEKGYGVNLVNKTLLEAFEIIDHFKAYEYLMKRPKAELNEKSAKSVHTILTKNTLPYKGHTPGAYSKSQMAAGDTVFRDTKMAIENMSKLLKSFDEALKQGKRILFNSVRYFTQCSFTVIRFQMVMAVWEGYYPLYRRTLQPPPYNHFKRR